MGLLKNASSMTAIGLKLLARRRFIGGLFHGCFFNAPQSIKHRYLAA
jgi:hypothetical protein